MFTWTFFWSLQESLKKTHPWLFQSQKLSIILTVSQRVEQVIGITIEIHQYSLAKPSCFCYCNFAQLSSSFCPGCCWICKPSSGFSTKQLSYTLFFMGTGSFVFLFFFPVFWDFSWQQRLPNINLCYTMCQNTFLSKV